MPKVSAGLLMYRRGSAGIEVLLVHPGGPLWARKDDGVWSLPKGELDEGEEALAAAQREFAEETGFAAPGPFIALGSIRQKGGKEVHAWAFAGDCDPTRIASMEFEMEWPPRSGRRQRFPEVDRAAFYSLADARSRINPAQVDLLDRLAATLA